MEVVVITMICVALLAGAALVVHGVWRVIRRASARCRHFWQPVKTHCGTYIVGGGAGTEVLWRCGECGTVRTENLRGHWTLQDIEGRRHA